MTLSRNARLGLLGVMLSLLAGYLIVSQVNLGLFMEALRTARYEYVIPGIVFLLMGLVTRALRWYALLGGTLPLRRAFSIMNVAYLVNGVLPLRMGEVARIYLASQAQPPVPALKCASTIIVERLLDLLAVVVMMLLALTTAPVPEALQTAGRGAVLTAVGGFLVLVFLATKRTLAQGILKNLTKHFAVLNRLHIATRLDEFLDGLTPITQPRSLALALGWTTLSWMFSVAAGYVLMFAFFPAGNLTVTLLYIAAAAFAIALPAVPGNVGTYEASILLALVASGYEQSGTALAFAVMVHAVNVFVHASTGVIGFIDEGISLEQLRSGVRQMRTASTGND